MSYSMEELVLNHPLILIDTCALMNAGSERLMETLIPVLEAQQHKVVLPYRCIQEIEKHRSTPPRAGSENDEKKIQAAQTAYRLCVELGKRDLLSLRGSRTDNFADNFIFVQCSIFRSRYDILVLTNDNKLTSDLRRLNEFYPERNRAVTVLAVTEDGGLEERRFH